MRVGVVTLFPEMLQALQVGVVGRAIQRGLFEIELWNPREFTTDIHHSVDDRPFGGGPGMVMKYEPLAATLTQMKAMGQTKTGKKFAASAPVIHLSPQGVPLTQALIAELAHQAELIVVCGRYEGIDQRWIDDWVDQEYCVGDFVVSGGELPAMMLMDAVCRQLPGVLGNADSAQEESFMRGVLDCPHYTRPVEVAGKTVPRVLMSGDHAEIARWRLKQSLGRTWQRRPELLKQRLQSALELELLEEFKKETKEIKENKKFNDTVE